jgi:hypothetical protein
MQTYSNYLQLRQAIRQAQTVLSYIGKEDHTATPGSGYVYSVTVCATVHYQPANTGNNFHKNEKLNDALAVAARDMWPQLRKRAEEIMAQEERDARVACRAELQEVLSELAEDERSRDPAERDDVTNRTRAA